MTIKKIREITKYCRLCGEDLPLVRSHIVPASFFREQRGDEKKLYLFSNKDEYKKRSQNGPYDDGNILCQACDSHIGVYDDYAFRLLCRSEDYEEIRESNELVAKTLKQFDYAKLKLFAISSLWRAHLTMRPEFSLVNLGPYASIAKQMILDRNPGDIDDFSTIVSCLISPVFGTNHGWVSPYREKYDAINAYRFHLPGFPLIIKVDSRPFDENMRLLALKDGQPLVMIIRDMESSPEYRFLKRQVLRIGRLKKS